MHNAVGEDFEAVSPDEFNQTFLSGADTGTLCLTVLALQDDIVEFSETYQVVLNSSDKAVLFTADSVQITIIDANIGMHTRNSCSQKIIIPIMLFRCLSSKLFSGQV